MSLIFQKYSGCGNTFLIYDNRSERFPHQCQSVIAKLCTSADVDGLILWNHQKNNCFSMRIFNMDGSEAEMCGNGIRCLIQNLRDYEHDHGYYVIETCQASLIGRFVSNEIKIDMPKVKIFSWEVALGEYPFKMAHLDTGVPHIVIFVSDVASIKVKDLGRQLRMHPYFTPKGVNVNFVQQITAEKVKIRTYERGVESETLACGTGATAAGLTTAYYNSRSTPIQVEVRSGEIITIDYRFKTPFDLEHVTMQGPVSYLGEHRSLLENKAFLDYDRPNSLYRGK